MAAPKAQAIPWTQQETLHLIHVYQHKWYALERGQLKSTHWDEVAATVAARCGHAHLHPSKTSLQCRHKMEKLRQRFRAEKRRLPLAAASPWPYFDLMDDLLRGPLPISARPMSSDSDSDSDPDSDSDENRSSKSRSMSHILRNRNREEEQEEEEQGKEMCWKVAAEIGLLAERLVGMESAKLEMMKEAQMRRMAMEKKRIEMILESEHKILSSISRAFGSPSPKRLKVGQNS